MPVRYSARVLVSISLKGDVPAYESEHGELLAPASVTETQRVRSYADFISIV
jgi:hypothetical protein